MKINEIFGNAIQGEGPFTGEPCIFVRTWGCIEPYCEFCDTQYSWSNESKESKEMSVEEIYNKIKEFGKNKLVVITGGEPFLQEDIYELCRRLVKGGYWVQIETSGKAKINPLPATIYIIMSPKQYDGKFILNYTNDFSEIDYFKFVVENEEEVSEVIKFVEKYSLPKKDIFLMSKGETREKQLDLMPKVFEWCNKYGFRYSTRLHVLAFNTKRGV
jgi:7-carboxy-7-deazaguanine synthase